MYFFFLSIKPPVQSRYEQKAAMSQTEFTTHKPFSSSWESMSTQTCAVELHQWFYGSASQQAILKLTNEVSSDLRQGAECWIEVQELK